jgi:hypothetical protein
MRKRQTFNRHGQPGISVQKNKVGSLLTPQVKINSNWIRSLNIKAEIVKENIGTKLHDLEFSHNLLAINKLDCIKT